MELETSRSAQVITGLAPTLAKSFLEVGNHLASRGFHGLFPALGAELLGIGRALVGEVDASRVVDHCSQAGFGEGGGHVGGSRALAAVARDQ